MKKVIFPLLFALLIACSNDATGNDPGVDPSLPPPAEPADLITYDFESTIALDPAGKEIAFDYPATREGKTVGIFYFIWQGAHGYDDSGYFNGDIVPPSASDVNSPYDISILEHGHTDPQTINFGPKGAMHHWGKPYLDYYVANDKWVIRKHAQMLRDAGIDVIFIDLTNGYAYLPVVKTLCTVYQQMLREGNRPPQISFVLNTNPAPVMQQLLTLYKSGSYDRLWYRMNGKPLVLAPLQDYGVEINNYYTFRYSWFDTQFGHGGDWYGDGTNRWSWGEFSHQRNVKEEIPVMAASHAHLNIGRSFSGLSPAFRGGSQPQNTTAQQRAAGTYFKQQFEHAVQCDPDLIFITGWNEWVAQRQIAENPMQFLGKNISSGDTYFVDCYNHEYSRDVEPCADDFKDTYYYYMVDYVRRYKGTKTVKPVNEIHRIAIDGRFDDWALLGTCYKDYRFDTEKRDHWGFGYKNLSLKNDTGRNDIYRCKVATDARMLYFYVETVDPISPSGDPKWMRLFIDVKSDTNPGWEGFQWVVNNWVVSDSKTSLQRSKGGWEWEDVAILDYAVKGRQMEIAIPLDELGITNRREFTIDFKWIDNAVDAGDICECMTDGDSAPDSRFRYRYIFKY